MDSFKRLPGSRRAPSGLEWKVLKALPSLLLAGTLVSACFILLLQSGLIVPDPKSVLKVQYTAIGLLLFHWMSVLMLAILCAIVVVMKGHAYVRDAYPLPDRDRPRS